MRLRHLGEQLTSTEIPTHPWLTPTLRNSRDPEKPGHTVSKGLDLAGSACCFPPCGPEQVSWLLLSLHLLICKMELFISHS